MFCLGIRREDKVLSLEGTITIFLIWKENVKFVVKFCIYFVCNQLEEGALSQKILISQFYINNFLHFLYFVKIGKGKVGNQL